MHEPRIPLLAGDSGRTFASMGLVILRESKGFFQRVISNPPKPEKRDYEATLAWRHETIHFIQSISTAFLYNHSLASVKYAFNVLDNLKNFLSIKNKTTAFESTIKALSAREYGLSVRDLLEGVAVIESFRMNTPNPNVLNFLKFRDDLFPGGNDSCYRKSFDYLSQRIDQSIAYHLISPLSFVALQSDNPPKSYVTIIEDLSINTSLDDLIQATIPEMFTHFGMNIHDHLLYNLNSVPLKLRHPILYECAKNAVDHLDIIDLIEMAARPSLIEYSEISREAIESLLPPMVAFSSSPGAKLEGMTFGLAKQEKEIGQLIMHTVGLIGAAERLTLFKESSDLFQFCPHSASCPHYASALCFNYFSPPSIKLGYANCGFIRFFESRAKMEPYEAWAKLNYIQDSAR